MYSSLIALFVWSICACFLFSQLAKLKALNHSPMSDASVNFDYKSPSPFDCSTDQEEKIEDVANHCLPQKDLYTTEEESDTFFSRKLMSHNGMEDSGGRGTGVKKKRKKKDPGEQEGTKGSKDREPKPKRKREPKEPKEPRKAKEPKRAKEPKEAKQKDGVKKPRKLREASGIKEAKEKRSCTDYVSRTNSKKARCVHSSLSLPLWGCLFAVSSSSWARLCWSKLCTSLTWDSEEDNSWH